MTKPFTINKLILIGLILLVALQYRLWLGEGGLQDVWLLEDEVAERNTHIQTLKDRNESLKAEVLDLKRGLSALEERARDGDSLALSAGEPVGALEELVADAHSIEQRVGPLDGVPGREEHGAYGGREREAAHPPRDDVQTKTRGW